MKKIWILLAFSMLLTSAAAQSLNKEIKGLTAHKSPLIEVSENNQTWQSFVDNLLHPSVNETSEDNDKTAVATNNPYKVLPYSKTPWADALKDNYVSHASGGAWNPFESEKMNDNEFPGTDPTEPDMTQDSITMDPAFENIQPKQLLTTIPPLSTEKIDINSLRTEPKPFLIKKSNWKAGINLSYGVMPDYGKVMGAGVYTSIGTNKPKWNIDFGLEGRHLSYNKWTDPNYEGYTHTATSFAGLGFTEISNKWFAIGGGVGYQTGTRTTSDGKKTETMTKNGPTSQAYAGFKLGKRIGLRFEKIFTPDKMNMIVLNIGLMK
ncbi:MAG: hypothetical protein JW812_00940 [Alphaproteobacteria bacterium]|nr:hypothetical protein [Alphaproteobacteria bacterium]MBN2780305.1 hypothetical protein [Alphaproteobacteria bacterium]